MIILVTMALLMSAGAETPGYILEPAGIEFNYLPEYLTPLLEGTMTEESGAVAGQPNSLGITFGCHYWKMDDPVTDKNLWIQEKLSSVVSPDLMAVIHTSAPTWAEGSTATSVSGGRSLGLMSEISFTFSPEGGVMGRGRAYGVFRNDYAVLLIIYGPSSINPQHDLEEMVANAVLSD
jgi:hypothetical protein